MRLVLTIIIALLTTPIWSAPIVVKSGDHSDFTRLVVYMPSGQNWRLNEAEGFTTLNVDGWDDGFNTSDVFQRIGTQRLRSLTAADDRLVLSLNCECTVVSNRLTGGVISLDIKDKSVRRPSRRPTNLDVPDAPRPTEAPPQDQDFVEWPVIFDETQIDPMLERVFQKPTKTLASEFEAGLGTEISRSATLTYLEPSGIELQGSASDVNKTASSSQDELLEELGQRAKFLNAGNSRSEVKEDPALSCPKPEKFEVSKWGGTEPFPDQLASLREDLFSEFDEISPAAVRNLIRFYVHFGLVEELGETIRSFPSQADFELLQNLGKIVRGEEDVVNFNPGNFQCGGEVGFWSFVAGESSEEITDKQIEELVAIFQILPSHLRELTSGRLIKYLDLKGFDVASGIIRSTLKRNAKSDSEDLPEGVISLDLATFSQEKLLELVRKNDEISPDALAIYIENGLENQTNFSSETLDLVGAYIHQLASSNTAKRLLSGHVLGLAASGQTVKAIDLLMESEDEEFLDPDMTKTELVKLILAAANPADVSTLMWRLANRGDLERVSQDVRYQLAQFLVAQGQPQLASVLLDNFEPTGSTRMEIAKTYAQDRRQADAIELLTDGGIDEIGPRLSEVLLTQDPTKAWELRDNLSGIAAERAAWISQNWKNVSSDPLRTDIAKLVLQSQQTNTETEKPIQDAQIVFSESQEARQVLKDLLE